jgi:hypothetical protein
VAIDSAPKYSRYPIARVRRLDHLETGLCDNAKSISGIHRVRLHDTLGKVSYYHNTVRAWAILLLTSATGGAAITTVIERGHW